MPAMSAWWGPAALMLDGSMGQPLSRSINGAAIVEAIKFQVDRSGTISAVQIHVSAKVGADRTYSVRLVPLASGEPDISGGNYGGSSTESWTPAATGHHTINFASGAAVTKGDELALVIVPAGPPDPDASNYITVTLGIQGMSGAHQMTWPQPTESADSGATWSSLGAAPGIGIQYADGDWLFADLGDSPTDPNDPALAAFHTDTTPDEVGARFQVPYAMTVAGVRFVYNATAGIHPTVHLYDSAGVELASAQIFNRRGNGARVTYAMFGEVALAANADYYVTLTNPSTTTTIKEPYRVTVQDADQRGGLPFCDGLRWARAIRTDGGAWTVTTTELPLMALYVRSVG